MTDTATPDAAEAPATAPAPAKPKRERIDARPVLEKLFQLHPKLFGARFLPLKLGIFEDLMARHPGAFTKEELKAALGAHARSSRYLEAVASGLQRHDLDAQPVEPVAADHVFHAIMEVFRRRVSRSPGEARKWLNSRVQRSAEASGLARDAYIEQVRAKDDDALAAIDEAFTQIASQQARREALRRAYEASGQSVEAFAEMYGMKPGEVRKLLA